MSLRELFRSGQRVGGGLTRELYYWAGEASIEIVRLGWSSTVSGMSHRSRVFTAGVVHYGTITLQGSARVFLRKKKEKITNTESTVHAKIRIQQASGYCRSAHATIKC